MIRKRRKANSKSDKTVDGLAKAAVGANSTAGMNREMKRMMAKREGAADRLRRPAPVKKKRTKPGVFLKEVRGELARVAWPTRNEVMTYTVVVIVTVIFFMVFIAATDYLSLEGVKLLLRKGTG